MKKILIVSIFFGSLVVGGCAPTIDEVSVQARSGAPVAARVGKVSIPRTPDSKRIFFVIQPVRVVEEGPRKVTTIRGDASIGVRQGDCENCISGSASISSSVFRAYLLQRQRQIALQFASAISGVQDFGLLDYEAFRTNPQKVMKVANDSEVYILRAVITELNYRVFDKKSKTYIPLISETKRGNVESVVGLDISAVNARTGEVAQAFSSQGSFLSRSVSSSAGFIADFSKTDIEVKSSVDQAIRVALNNAAKILHEKTY